MTEEQREKTTLQTLATAQALGLGVMQYVMGRRQTDQHLSNNGRTVLGEQLLTEIQNANNSKLLEAMNAHR